MRLPLLLSAAMLAALAGPAAAQSGDSRFERYLDSAKSCGVIGYCKTTAEDMLERGPTGGQSQPFLQLGRRDACRGGKRTGRSCRVQYQPRGASPEMYVDIEPKDVAPQRVKPPARAGKPESRHVRWCQQRYRSYRLSDNSFQPNKGARKQCDSPFS